MQRLKQPKELSTTWGGGKSPAEFRRNVSSKAMCDEGGQKWAKKPNRGEPNAKRIASPGPRRLPLLELCRVLGCS